MTPSTARSSHDQSCTHTLPQRDHARKAPRRRAATHAAVSCVLLAITGLSVGCRSSGSAYTPPTDSERQTSRAEVLTKQAVEMMDRNPQAAEEVLRKALAADLYHGPAHNNLGVLYLKQNKLYEAANEFEWARRVMPGHPDPRMNLAVTLERAGQTDEALKAYDTALEVYPDHLPTVQALARLQVKAGKSDERTPKFLKDIALRGEPPQWRDWARLQMSKTATP